MNQYAINMKNLSGKVLVVFGMFLFTASAIAQEGDTTTVVDEKLGKDKRPVKDPFESGYLMNTQTIVLPTAKTLEFVILFTCKQLLISWHAVLLILPIYHKLK